MRNRLIDFRLSRGPKALGINRSDVASCADIANAATERLLYARESNDSGFWGGWAEMTFTASQTDPYLTTPREVARLEAINACTYPVQIHNQFFEYMRFGFGRMPKTTCNTIGGCTTTAYERGTFPSLSDLVPPNKIIRVTLTDATDENKRTLIQGKDNNGQTIYSMDNGVQVEGIFVTLTAPLADFPLEMSKLTGIQKDITNGAVKYYEVDTVTADSRLIASLEPGETVANYRRYYLDHLPANCCGGTTVGTVQLTAIAKLDFIPVRVDTDYLLVGNIEALINECQSVRMETTDLKRGKEMSEFHHRAAIRLLNGELIHREGKLEPSILFKPFGSASLTRLGFGMIK